MFHVYFLIGQRLPAVRNLDSCFDYHVFSHFLSLYTSLAISRMRNQYSTTFYTFYRLYGEWMFGTHVLNFRCPQALLHECTQGLQLVLELGTQELVGNLLLLINSAVTKLQEECGGPLPVLGLSHCGQDPGQQHDARCLWWVVHLSVGHNNNSVKLEAAESTTQQGLFTFLSRWHIGATPPHKAGSASVYMNNNTVT